MRIYLDLMSSQKGISIVSFGNIFLVNVSHSEVLGNYYNLLVIIYCIALILGCSIEKKLGK